MNASASASASASERTIVRASRAVDVTGVIADAWVLFDGAAIAAVGNGREAPAADRVVDLGDATITPGFIDLHGHGAAGAAYEGGAGAVRSALAAHRLHGTTRAVLSLVANPVDALTGSLGVIRQVMAADPLVLGAHLEGPFLSPDNRGAHSPDFLVPPTAGVVDQLLEAGDGVVRQITVAPELPHAVEAIGRIVNAGVIAAVGHTVCTYEQAVTAFDSGARLLTHACNAMPGLHHRAPGPIAAATENADVTLELILDTVHVHASVARILTEAAPGRVALITDAMSATAAPDGNYMLGSLAVTVSGGVARVAGTETIAGSTLTQDTALRNAVTLVGLSLTEAVAALTAVPAGVLGIDDRFGRFAPGYAADLVVLTPDLRVRSVWADGVELSRTGTPAAGAAA